MVAKDPEGMPEFLPDLVPILSPPSYIKEWNKNKEKHLQTYIKDEDDRQSYREYLEHTATGGRLKDFLCDHNITWVQLQKIQNWNPSLQALEKAAKWFGEEYRQIVREDEADRRALEGARKGVYYKGRKVAEEAVPSDQLLALKLKAGNPDKYAEKSKVEHQGGVTLQFNLQGVPGGTPGVKDPIDITPEGDDDVS